jgi:hypothetical protein
MPSNIRVLHLGLGPIGAAIAAQIAARHGVRSVGAVDVDDAKLGRDLGRVIGLDKRLGVVVQDDLAAALRRSKPDIVVHCTSSSLAKVMPQLEVILKSKTPIVSTTEELAYPHRADPRRARTLHAAAVRAKVAILATGVNPGFAMDALPIVITAACERIDRIAVNRVQDARQRRLPFQQKIGAGLTAEQFRKQVKAGTVRHVGFTQSIGMIADSLGWKLDKVTETIGPKMATETVAGDLLAVDAGYVSGIIQDGVGYVKGQPVIALHLEAYLGAPKSYDSIEIIGSPMLSMTFDGGIHGDIATASMVVNSIPRVLRAQPGLHTMRDLTLPSFWNGSAA